MAPSRTTNGGPGSSTVPEPLGELAQETPPLRRRHPASGERREPLVELRPDEGAPKLLGRHGRRPRAAEGAEDELALVPGGDESAAHQPQRLLGRVVAVELLAEFLLCTNRVHYVAYHEVIGLWTCDSADSRAIVEWNRKLTRGKGHT